jgi:hypothetical protein
MCLEKDMRAKKDNKLIEAFEHVKLYTWPSGILKGFLCEKLHPGETGSAFHRAGRAGKKSTYRHPRNSSACHRSKLW